MSFKYLNKISERLSKTNKGYITISEKPQFISVDLYLNFDELVGYHANIIIDKNGELKIEIPLCDYIDFAYIYLYAIITIQMILNKISIPPIVLINNFIEFVNMFDISKMNYSYQAIMNSGLFNVKFSNGDCELNSAFLIYIINYAPDIIKFGNLKHVLFKEQLYPWNLKYSYFQFKIMIYILFMKFIIGHRILIGGKMEFDKMTLPINKEDLANFGDSNYYFNDNNFAELSCCYHSFIVDYIPSYDCYEIYDLNRPDSKLCIYQYEHDVVKNNETYFNVICYKEDIKYPEASYYVISTQTGHIFEYNYGILKFDSKENIKITLTFNQFKYIVLNFIALDIYRNDENTNISLNDNIGHEIIKRLLILPAWTDYYKLNEIISISN